ncbi:hypothetical protein F4780DRAFT_774498 [Xylariomycetidae sp. FL0641]|nr:hypothetical protein F4780DRAFT_774498 [Xylariomycetidae sp. FL0641]
MNQNPTDEELDRNWQPNGRRPQSYVPPGALSLSQGPNLTVARSFSAELMDIFRIDNSLADLDEQVVKRKQQVTTGQSELEALEARIKEMEARLNKQSPTGPQGSAPAGSSGQQASTSKPAAQGMTQIPLQTSRPGTAKQPQQVPLRGGAMPPTPTASEGEYDQVQSWGDGDESVETRSFADYVLVSKDGGDR